MKTRGLSDTKLVERLLQRVSRERDCTADVIEDLAEVDARGIYVKAGCSSLSSYCVEVLGYSETEAYPRVAVARLVGRFPQALQLLRDGRMSLSTLRLVDPHLKDANADERLAAAVGLTVKKLEVLIASWAPKPDVPTTVSFIPAHEPPRLLQRMEVAAAAAQLAFNTAAHELATTLGEAIPAAAPDSSVPASAFASAAAAANAMAVLETASPSISGASGAVAATPAASAIATTPTTHPTRPAPLPKPLSPGKRKIEFTIDEDEYDALMRLRDLDRHAIPDGDIKKIIVAAVRDRLAKVEARKLGKLKRGKPAHLLDQTAPNLTSASVATDKRAPTQAQKREVAAREGERCCYVAPDGKRCSSTGWLELDHTDPWWHSHATRSDQLQFLCRIVRPSKFMWHDDGIRTRLTLEPV